MNITRRSLFAWVLGTWYARRTTRSVWVGTSHYLDNLRHRSRPESQMINGVRYPIYGTPIESWQKVGLVISGERDLR